MDKKYKIDLFDLDSYDALLSDFQRLKTAIASPEFMEFLADKCIMELSRISNEKLGGIREDDVTYSEVDKYRSNHEVEIGTDFVRISNDTMADLSHVSEKTLANYPDGLSIAKIIEFGTGISRNRR